MFLKIDLFGAEIMRVSALLGNASVLDQSGLEHASPLASGGMFSNGGANMNMNRWNSPSPIHSEVRILTINITFTYSNYLLLLEAFLTFFHANCINLFDCLLPILRMLSQVVPS